MLLESDGILSIPAIAKMFDQGSTKEEIYFRYRQKVNLPLSFKEETITIIEYDLFEVFRDVDGYLKYAYPSTNIEFLSFLETPPNDNEYNKKIIGDNAIKKFSQLFGINTVDYKDVYKKHFNAFGVRILYTEDFLKLLNEAYQWRQEVTGDL